MGNAIKEIEVTIEDCKVMIDRGNTLERLLQHPDFNSLIMKGYMERESHRLTLMLGDPVCESGQGRENVLRDLSAIAQLNAFFRTVRKAAEVAERTLKDNQEELELVLASELEE